MRRRRQEISVTGISTSSSFPCKTTRTQKEKKKKTHTSSLIAGGRAVLKLMMLNIRSALTGAYQSKAGTLINPAIMLYFYGSTPHGRPHPSLAHGTLSVTILRSGGVVSFHHNAVDFPQTMDQIIHATRLFETIKEKYKQTEKKKKKKDTNHKRNDRGNTTKGTRAHTLTHTSIATKNRTRLSS